MMDFSEMVDGALRRLGLDDEETRRCACAVGRAFWPDRTEFDYRYAVSLAAAMRERMMGPDRG
jgi:hypothetical protein